MEIQSGQPMTRRFTTWSICVAFLLCMITVLPIAAQVQTGSIHGTVSDPTGAVIPSASIVLSNKDGLSKQLTSGADGSFTIDHLVPGRYSLAVNGTGFADVQLDDVMVYSGKTTPEKISLKVAVEQQQVMVNDQGLS